MISKLRPAALIAAALMLGLFGLVAAPMNEARAEETLEVEAIALPRIPDWVKPCSMTVPSCAGWCPLLPLNEVCCGLIAFQIVFTPYGPLTVPVVVGCFCA